VGCTAIVVQNNEGCLFLGRNLDYSLEEFYSKLSI
jgi:penicillin V acylase-like amidase (Ntn superfamily)